MDETVVRVATILDATAIARVQVEAWRSAYAGIMPQAFLDGMTVEAQAERWRGIFEAHEAEGAVRGEWSGTVAVAAAAGYSADAGDIVGFVAFAAAPDDRGRTVGRVYSLYVRPNAWGRGLGHALFRYAERGLARHRFTRAELAVAADNVRARRFYESHGWTTDGVPRVEDALGVLVSEVFYVRELAADLPGAEPV